jgi:membrane-associated protease RseP (regulator of RpoE activity)
MQIFITILILILMLGILVSSHEAGHLVMAKCFNVYCLEYSIGFGPKLFSKKRKGGETAFSLRAFPLGGYVSMFGEGVELPDGVAIPTERSLEGIAKWKRALITIAGIVVNLLLSILFVFIYTVGFQSYYLGASFDTGVVDQNGTSIAANSLWGEGTIGDFSFNGDTNRLYSPFAFNGSYVVDSEADIDGKTYVATVDFTGIGDFNLIDHLTFYYPVSAFYPSTLREAIGLYNFPDTAKSSFKTMAEGSVLTLHLTTMDVAGKSVTKPSAESFQSRSTHVLTSKGVLNSDNDLIWEKNSSNSFSYTSYSFYPSLSERLALGCEEYAYLFQAFGLGIKEIFTTGVKNLGSVVMMGSMLSTASTSIGWGRTFFLFGGYLSLNLAIFNLLPFPGLDGWSLLVTAIEGITRKKVPEKIKNVVSFIGLALLFGLGIFLIVKDVITVFLG